MAAVRVTIQSTGPSLDDRLPSDAQRQPLARLGRGADGVKTGYTQGPGFNLVTSVHCERARFAGLARLFDANQIGFRFRRLV